GPSTGGAFTPACTLRAPLSHCGGTPSDVARATGARSGPVSGGFRARRAAAANSPDGARTAVTEPPAALRRAGRLPALNQRQAACRPVRRLAVAGAPGIPSDTMALRGRRPAPEAGVERYEERYERRRPRDLGGT